MATPSFPTRFELGCVGISMILANILLIVAGYLQQIDHDLYNVATNESVIELHKKVSSPEYRFKVEVSCVLFWATFPLSLAAIHGMKKTIFVFMHNTSGELFMYMAEKAYILEVGIGLVLLPALSLTTVSFDWNYETVSPSDGTAPQSYWIQLYLILYRIEIIDCLSVCDATFMISYFMCIAYGLYDIRNEDPKHTHKGLVECIKIVRGERLYQCGKYALSGLITFCCCSMSIIFLMILFQFAESGFFSVTGDINAEILFIFLFIARIFIGLRHISWATYDRYSQLQKIFGEKSDNNYDQKIDEKVLAVRTEQYAMQMIDVEEDLEKGSMNETR